MTDIEIDVLPGADGSAKYSSQGTSVLASVNGPVEVPRRDELPDEATIEVSIRPSTGLAGIRERFFEGLIHQTLKQVVRTNQHPRTLIQVTLQITASLDNDTTYGRPSQAASLLYLLPPLLNAAMLALLSSSIPLSSIICSILVMVGQGGQILTDPTPKQMQSAISVHAMAFSSQGDMLLAESEGSFDVDEWHACSKTANVRCIGVRPKNTEVTVPALIESFEQKVGMKIKHSEQWRRNMKGQDR